MPEADQAYPVFLRPLRGIRSAGLVGNTTRRPSQINILKNDNCDELPWVNLRTEGGSIAAGGTARNGWFIDGREGSSLDSGDKHYGAVVKKSLTVRWLVVLRKLRAWTVGMQFLTRVDCRRASVGLRGV